MAAAASLKEYLKRYQTPGAAAGRGKKKKPKPNPIPSCVLVVDEDPVWHKPVDLEAEPSESSGDEKPLVEEDIEVKRMKRMEAIRALKPYDAISEDGSGWVSIPYPSKHRLGTSGPGEGDLSPPGQHREENSGEGDLSSPRQRGRRLNSPSPGTHRRPLDMPSEAGGDLSPPRRHLNRPSEAGGDLSPSRRRLDPPSPHRRRSDTPSEAGGDLSPLRRCLSSPSPGPHRRRLDTPSEAGGDLSPPRRRARESLSRSVDASDLSPPRKIRRGSPGDHPSPPRNHRPSDALHKSGSEPVDLSPSRRRGRKDSLSDLSPPRRIRPQESIKTREFHAEDLSLPRWSRAPESSRTKQSEDTDLSWSPSRKRMKEVKPKTGLLSAKDLRDELAKKRKDDLARFRALDPSLTGKDAQAVFRDKQGKRISKEELMKAQEESKPKEKKLEWGKGLAQKREAEAAAEELELEKDKPFARTRDDPDLDKMLKEQVRWGDPMAHLVKRKHSELLLEDLGDNEKMKESGFIVPQNIPSHSWIKRGVDSPANRYGIHPGRHWDGVNRSNGYEKELFKRQNEKRATETEAYLWSVSDM